MSNLGPCCCSPQACLQASGTAGGSHTVEGSPGGLLHDPGGSHRGSRSFSRPSGPAFWPAGVWQLADPAALAAECMQLFAAAHPTVSAGTRALQTTDLPLKPRVTRAPALGPLQHAEAGQVTGATAKCGRCQSVSGCTMHAAKRGRTLHGRCFHAARG